MRVVRPLLLVVILSIFIFSRGSAPRASNASQLVFGSVDSVRYGAAAATELSYPRVARFRLPELPPKVEIVEDKDDEDEEEEEREDQPGEAAEFHLLKRTGGGPIPMDRMLDAQRHARRMPLYSLAKRQFLGGSVTALKQDVPQEN